MSMNKTNTVDAHVSSTPLVICVGDESRMWEFEENSFLAFVYKQLRVELEYPGAPNYGYPLSPIHTRNHEYYRLDERLYKLGLEGRRVVILAPPYTGPRKDNPADRVAGYLRVSVYPGL